DAQSAINDLNGKWHGSRQIRCNWAAKGAGSDDKQRSDTKNYGQEKSNENALENNPQYTIVYVGNLTPEVTSTDLHCHFHALGAGVIEDVRIQQDKGFGFIRYSSHAEAARAIQLGNTRYLYGKPLKCSWGSKPTPPGSSLTPLPLPITGSNLGFPAMDIAAYERQMALSKMAGMMHQQMMVGAASQGYPGIAATQAPMYYQ
ncbi:hypothetical protein M8C21_020539, partial [Ambrosia artemisiifolia]